MARNQDQELTRPVLPTAATVKFAQDLVHRLAGPQGRFALVDRETNKTTEIDETFYRLIQQLLVNLAQNRAVSIIPIAHELTTHQAAEVLNVSRPFLVGLLDKGAIPHRKVGTHRRIRLEDLLDYQEKTRVDGEEALEELAKLTQEHRLGY